MTLAASSHARELRAAATSGLMALTGRPDGPPLSPPPGMVEKLDRWASTVREASRSVGDEVDPDWCELVTVRARMLGLRRQGRVSANGTCRLLRGADGFVALNLPRPEDEAAVAAVVECPVAGDPWTALEEFLDRRSAAELVGRARLLGVPAAQPGGATAPAWREERRWAAVGTRPIEALRVVDLSSMWAGPLASHLLTQCGASVVKVESASRPDGARAVPAFYRTLHAADQPLVRLDVHDDEGRAELRRLVTEADVVIDSSRPRALEQLGAGPDTISGPPGKVWLSITGHGRGEPHRHWVAFGDDAAVAGGLVAWEDEAPVFCGDALADPVTGMVAAAAALQAIADGGGVLLDVSMAGCAGSLAPKTHVPSVPAEQGPEGWRVVVDGGPVLVRDRADEAQSATYTTRPATTVASTAG